jgi:glycosyltransferase involved in cell wall biosynthesis
MIKKKGIFFFGELPPRTIHGASISNGININILKQFFSVSCVEEYSDLKYHNSFNVSKMKHFLSTVLKSWTVSISKKFNFYYGVIYLSTFGILKNLLTICVFKLFNPSAKVILHFHRSDFNMFLEKRLNRFLFFVLDSLIHKYIVLAKKQVKEISMYTKKEICLLYNTIEESQLIKESVLKKSSTLQILFLSNYIKEKGFYDLIEAQKKINKLYPNEFQLVAYGAFANSSEESLVSSLEEHNIWLNNRVYGNEKCKILNSADVIALPSYNEGLPLILLEGMSLGKPIILSNVGYINEVLGNDYPLYCEPNNIDSIVNCIVRFKEHYHTQEFSEWIEAQYSKFSMKEHIKELKLIFSE